MTKFNREESKTAILAIYTDQNGRKLTGGYCVEDNTRDLVSFVREWLRTFEEGNGYYLHFDTKQKESVFQLHRGKEHL